MHAHIFDQYACKASTTLRWYYHACCIGMNGIIICKLLNILDLQIGTFPQTKLDPFFELHNFLLISHAYSYNIWLHCDTKSPKIVNHYNIFVYQYVKCVEKVPFHKSSHLWWLICVEIFCMCAYTVNKHAIALRQILVKTLWKIKSIFFAATCI